MTASFDTGIRRIAAHRGRVVLEDACGHQSILLGGRMLRSIKGRLFIEPERTEWYSWTAFRSWRSQESAEKRKCQN